MKIKSAPAKKARIEIIPMIDAIFFLLVFFMFSSLSMVKMKAVNVALPTAAQGGASAVSGKQKLVASPAKIVVTVNDKGQYFVNRKRVSSSTLVTVLQSDLSARKGAVVVVNVAKTQSAQSLINVMDSVRRVTPRGSEELQVLIATEPVDFDGNALRPNASARAAS